MQPSIADMAHIVYQCSIPKDLMECTCDSYMLKLLVSLDGGATLAAIAKKLGLPIKSVSEAANRLLALKLIAPADGVAIHVDQSFMDFLKEQLSIAVGPIAEIIIEDTIKDFGFAMTSFPTYKVADLVALLAQEIQHEDHRRAFQQKMLERIKHN
ncbi:MAG: hypothetical protein WAU91_04405 [Desulfatitalea sp.]